MSDSDDDYLYSSATKWYVLRNLPSREYHTHPINQKRLEMGEYHQLYQELEEYPDRFYQYLRMEPTTFQYILSKIKDKMHKKWQNWHKLPISAEENLVVTLRYLGTGAYFRSLAFSFRMEFSTIASMVVLWDELQPIHMPTPTVEQFEATANKFWETWNFPNCIGAIDGKHVRIKFPAHSGSMYYNYKNFFSLVLLGVVDADYKFLIVDIGGYGKQRDGGTFRASKMYHLMHQNQLNIPPDSNLPNTDVKMPFVFIGAEAFPLLDNLMKPFGGTNTSPEAEYFDKRLSRARKTVKCRFGIISSKWRILGKAIETKESTAKKIIKAICVLHNTIIDKEGFQRNLKEIVEIPPTANMQNRPIERPADSSKQTRNTFKWHICRNRIAYQQ